MKTQVTTTSRQTYMDIDLSSVRGKVAAEIRRLTREGKRAYISLVAHTLNMEKSTVAGRFNELKAAEFMVNGHWYKMQDTGTHLMPDPKFPVKQRRVETWAIVNCDPPVQQPTLF